MTYLIMKRIFKKHIWRNEKKGHVATNPNRKSSSSRKYLQSEKQLWGRMGLIKKTSSNRYFFQNEGYIFNNSRIEKLVENFYKNYGDVNSKLIFDQRKLN